MNRTIKKKVSASLYRFAHVALAWAMLGIITAMIVGAVTSGMAQNQGKAVAQHLIEEYGKENAKKNGSWWYLVDDNTGESVGFPGNEGTKYAQHVIYKGVNVCLPLRSGSFFETKTFPTAVNPEPEGTHWEYWDGEKLNMP